MGKLEKVTVTTQDGSAEPVLLIGLGRGRVGKSTMLRFIVERARNAGRDVIVADGDMRNPTLSSIFADARRPVSAEPAEVKDWLSSLLNEAVQERRSVVLDLGGGDRALEEFGRDLALIEFCEATGLVPVGVAMVGPDQDDLRHIASIEAGGAFRAGRTMAVLNEALVRQGSSTEAAFRPIIAAPEWAVLEGRGARSVLMRRLPCLPDLDRAGLGLFGAAAGEAGRNGTPIGPVQRFMVKQWLRSMEDEMADASRWLP